MLMCAVKVQNEVKLLVELLPKYVAHVEKHPHTLLVKFFGLYRVLPENGSKVGARFPNVLPAERQNLEACVMC